MSCMNSSDLLDFLLTLMMNNKFFVSFKANDLRACKLQHFNRNFLYINFYLSKKILNVNRFEENEIKLKTRKIFRSIQCVGKRKSSYLVVFFSFWWAMEGRVWWWKPNEQGRKALGCLPLEPDTQKSAAVICPWDYLL